MFHPEVSSPNWLHFNCLPVESYILTLDNKHEEDEDMLFSLLGAIFLVWLKKLRTPFSYISHNEVMKNYLYLFHHTKTNIPNPAAPICSRVAFESQKMSAASRAAKLLFLFLLESNSNIDSFPSPNMTCSIIPSKCAYKSQKFLNVT